MSIRSEHGDLVEAMARAMAVANENTVFSKSSLGRRIKPDDVLTLGPHKDKRYWEIFVPQASAALFALDAAGYAVVPKVPTEVMTRAAHDPSRANGSAVSKGAVETYQEMLAAAPKVMP